ncbi:MAG: trehalose-6-phosphate synthase [Corynebacterium sp.]|nr:trehalose-6-phosphate synthase [Corynebacterium sp.]
MERYEFVVLANRLPVDIHYDAAGNRVFSESPGGLVSAMRPILAAQRGCWIGWPGVIDSTLDELRTADDIAMYPVALSSAEYEDYYEGFCNATLWPLYHDRIVTPQFHRHWWDSYREVNLRFAQAAAQLAAPGAVVWVQDYQLQLVPGILRELRPDVRIGFFLHIPFPAPEIFRQLPWREEIVRGLNGAHLLGFQLDSNAQNYRDLTASHPQVGAYPISIDLTSYGEPTHPEQVRAAAGKPKHLLLGVDRLDYTKGILQRLLAFEELLDEGALDADETVFVQVATPSRERIEHYKQTRAQVEEAVGRINGRFGSLHHAVIQYHHRPLEKSQLRELYAAADVMVVTPLKDGMNLVAKEYVASHGEGHGNLVLSEFAGAAQELREAHVCNPFDIDSIKAALMEAINNVNPAAMQTMHATVSSHPVQQWAAEFLRDLKAAQ